MSGRAPADASTEAGAAGAAAAVLGVADAEAKARAARHMAAQWRDGLLAWPGARPDLPARPARPGRPALVPPRDVPRRRPGSAQGRFALLHALAHIELNAIDLACDLIARFAHGPETLPRAFADDWMRVADEEGKHFMMLHARLGELGGDYGDLPAHDGLWEAAADTAHDLAARLAVVPLVHEARGLDVTPATVEALDRAGDDASARLLEAIYRDEIGHVAAGSRWFRYIAAQRGEAPEPAYARLVARYHGGRLKGPFNETAREAAGCLSLTRAAAYESGTPAAPAVNQVRES